MVGIFKKNVFHYLEQKRLPDTDYRPFDEKKFLNIVGSAVKNVCQGCLV